MALNSSPALTYFEFSDVAKFKKRQFSTELKNMPNNTNAIWVHNVAYTLFGPELGLMRALVVTGPLAFHRVSHDYMVGLHPRVSAYTIHVQQNLYRILPRNILRNTVSKVQPP